MVNEFLKEKGIITGDNTEWIVEFSDGKSVNICELMVEFFESHHNMSKNIRDDFAIAYAISNSDSADELMSDIACDAYTFADYMIEERMK